MLQLTNTMVHHSTITHLGEEPGWFGGTNFKKKRNTIPAANWILIKQRRRRLFCAVIYEAESAQQKNRRIRARHQKLQHLLFLMIGCGLVHGGQALDQGGQVASLTPQVALYLTLGNLLYHQPCFAGTPPTKKYVGISEINSHGPGDTHVSIKR